MIVYNVKRGFFAMKSEADAHRRELGLRPNTVNKITINDRDQLAAFLNALAQGVQGAPAQGVEPLPLDDAAFDFVPDFVRRDWEARRRNAKREG